MTSLARRIFGQVEERDSFPLPFQDWVNYFNLGGINYGVALNTTQTLTGNQEKPVPGSYTTLIEQTYKQNAIVFALMALRQMHFSQVRFQYQQMTGGRPGRYWGDSSLQILETPWPNGTTADLLARMITDVDTAGNSFIVREGDTLGRLNPEWTSILLGSKTRRDTWVPGDPDTEVAAYIYKPGGYKHAEPEIVYPPSLVAHWAQYPDPFAVYRGMSWLTPVLREIIGDQSMTAHKQKFLDQGATVNMVVKFPTENLELFERAVSKFRQGHQGLANAYKTLYLMQGMDATPVGSDFQQMTFSEVQAAGETRMAAAAGVPPILAGFTEGLKGASLNSGNYQTARRRFADGTMVPMWEQAAGALATIVKVPSGSRLWYDGRDVPFLKDDAKEEADIRQVDATTINTLTMAGFPPDAIVDAVTSNDFSRLVGTHTGLTSVQLHPPGSEPSLNGNGNRPSGSTQLVPQ